MLLESILGVALLISSAAGASSAPTPFLGPPSHEDMGHMAQSAQVFAPLWGQHRMDAQHTGYTPRTTFSDGDTLIINAWVVYTGGTVDCSPSVAASTVFFTAGILGRECDLFVVGLTLTPCTYAALRLCSLMSPHLHFVMVAVVAAADGQLYAVDGDTGVGLWNFSTGFSGRMTASPVVSPDSEQVYLFAGAQV
jgi:outer membrane protein assembly factor BamB